MYVGVDRIGIKKNFLPISRPPVFFPLSLVSLSLSLYSEAPHSIISLSLKHIFFLSIVHPLPTKLPSVVLCNVARSSISHFWVVYMDGIYARASLWTLSPHQHYSAVPPLLATTHRQPLFCCLLCINSGGTRIVQLARWLIPRHIQRRKLFS